MVKGLDIFREYFKDHQDKFVIIGYISTNRGNPPHDILYSIDIIL